MGAKRKIFISMLSIAFVILAVLATIAVAFALTQQNITTSLSIDYVAIDIDGSVSATYTFGGVETSMLTSDNKPELVFRAADKTNAGSLNMPENTFSFSSVNDNIVLKYTFKNTGDVDYTAIVNFAETDVASENMKLEYSLDGLSYSTTNYGLVVTNAKPREYYLKISIDDKAKNASFTGTFSWVLERYIPTEGEENVVLNTSSYMVNADSETYSATFNPESNLTTNSTWYVPSSIGSQQITRIILDDTLPANTKLVVPKGITEVWVGNPDTYEESTCSGLVEVHLSETVTAAGKHAMYWYDGFVGCNNLARISVAPGNPNYKSVNNCVISGSSIVVGTIESVIPDNGSVTSISAGAFDGKNIKSLYVPEQITVIEDMWPYALPANGCIIYCESARSEASWYEYTDEYETHIMVNGNDVFKFDYSPEAYAQDLAIGEALSAANPGFEYVGSILVGYTGGATAVAIPEGTTSMRAIFSGNKTITSVTLPSTLTEVGGSAFSGCTGLTNITIPANVETIGDSAFRGCTGLTNISIPASVEIIGGSAFSGCTGLTNITIPANVETIGSSAFYGCTGLTNITIPANIETIGSSAFSGCTGLTNVTFNENCNLKTIGGSAFKGCTGLTNISIPASVETIAGNAFQACSNLTSVTFAENSQLTTLDSYVFYQCSKLTSIELPSSLTSLTGSSFYKTPLETISIKSGGKYISVNNCIIDPSTKTLIAGAANSVIPNDGSVTTIGPTAFYENKALKEINIPKTITRLENECFVGCSNLKKVDVEDVDTLAIAQTSVNGWTNPLYAGNAALYLNGELVTNLVLSDKLTSICQYAFTGCSSITSVTIPSTIRSIGSGAFSGCSKLTAVYIDDLDKWASISFSGTSSNPLYYAKKLYLNGNLLTNLELNCTVVGKYAFYNCTSITSITFTDKVTTINESAFYKCSGLTNITLGSGLTSIYSNAFSGCSKLTSAIFTNPNGWVYKNNSWGSETGTALDVSALSNANTAATYLRSTYVSKYWKCTQ